MRLENKTAIVVGGGQSSGSTSAIGNGRATAILFAREGAKVLVVDRNLSTAMDTVNLITKEGNIARAEAADVTSEYEIAKAIGACNDTWGKVDILHNNVGVSLAGGDAPIEDITTDAFDHLINVNLRGMVYTTKHVLPIMREQCSGAIINISSMAAWSNYPLVGYKTTKSAVIALTEQTAAGNAEFNIRANVILPGLIDTPMAVDTRAREWNRSREEIAAERNSKVPLGRKMGTGWDVAYAALFLASDEAKFITGVALNVDGGSNVT